MKDEIFEVMYEEVYGGFGGTSEYKKAESVFCDGSTVEQRNENFDLFSSAVDAECEQAFRSGFYAAVSLLMGGAN